MLVSAQKCHVSCNGFPHAISRLSLLAGFKYFCKVIIMIQLENTFKAPGWIEFKTFSLFTRLCSQCRLHTQWQTHIPHPTIAIKFQQMFRVCLSTSEDLSFQRLRQIFRYLESVSWLSNERKDVWASHHPPSSLTNPSLNHWNHDDGRSITFLLRLTFETVPSRPEHGYLCQAVLQGSACWQPPLPLKVAALCCLCCAPFLVLCGAHKEALAQIYALCVRACQVISGSCLRLGMRKAQGLPPLLCRYNLSQRWRTSRWLFCREGH